MANSFTGTGATAGWNKHDYVVALRRRLNKPTNWGAVLNDIYSDVYTIVNGYMSTEPSVVSGTRGTAYTYQDFTVTQEALTISTYKNIPMFVDEADRHQQSYVTAMSIADFQGRKLNEAIETAMCASHSSFRDFGTTDLDNTSADDSTAITVSATNIDDIIRAVKRKIFEHNGVELAMENGMFFLWRPGDYELLEAFVQANGFSEADTALKNGVPIGMRYMGVEHYLTTSAATNHVFAGVKKLGEVGILRSTYGRAKFLEDPPVANAGAASGLGIVSRVDYGFKFSANWTDMFIDLNVA